MKIRKVLPRDYARVIAEMGIENLEKVVVAANG